MLPCRRVQKRKRRIIVYGLVTREPVASAKRGVHIHFSLKPRNLFLEVYPATPTWMVFEKAASDTKQGEYDRRATR